MNDVATAVCKIVRKFVKIPDSISDKELCEGCITEYGFKSIQMMEIVSDIKIKFGVAVSTRSLATKLLGELITDIDVHRNKDSFLNG